MPTEVYLVKVGMNMTEGIVEEWCIPDGGHVEVGELLYRLETEKVNLDVGAEAAGTGKHVVAVYNEIKDAVRTGLGRHGPERILVMPWQGYARITEDDAWSIVAYLRSLEPIEHDVPVNVPVGRSTSETYVHFGVYRSKGLPPM